MHHARTAGARRPLRSVHKIHSELITWFSSQWLLIVPICLAVPNAAGQCIAPEAPCIVPAARRAPDGSPLD
jgi:hypothetical protein